MDTNFCLHCSKKIRNFTARSDWGSRKYHLKCWKDIQDHNRFLECIKEMSNTLHTSQHKLL